MTNFRQKTSLLILMLLISVLFLTACNNKEYVHVGQNWKKIHQLQASEQSFKVTVKGVKSDYALGEKLTFKVNSEQSGRLWIIQVDPNDQVSLIMPNQLQSDNQIIAQQVFNFPPQGVSWSAPASEPIGKSVLAFIVTTGNADLNTVINGQNNNQTVIQETYQAIKNGPSWGLESKIVNISQ